MSPTISITEARNRLEFLPEELGQDPEKRVVAVTRRRKPVLAVMPWEHYESLMETLEVLADTELVEAIRQSMREIEEGKTIPIEEIEKELGL